MKLFDVINASRGSGEICELSPMECKIHLAVWNGFDNPLDLYIDGKFKEWEEGQTKRNFERKYILSLITVQQ